MTSSLWNYTDQIGEYLVHYFYALDAGEDDPPGDACQYIGHLVNGQLDGHCVYCGRRP